jgi:hypothetical protein
VVRTLHEEIARLKAQLQLVDPVAAAAAGGLDTGGLALGGYGSGGVGMGASGYPYVYAGSGGGGGDGDDSPMAAGTVGSGGAK